MGESTGDAGRQKCYTGIMERYCGMLAISALAAAGVCAQQTDPAFDKASLDCRLADMTDQANAVMLAGVPQLQAAADKLQPVLAACDAFRASPDAQSAAQVIAAMGAYNPQLLPAQQRLAKFEAQAAGATGLQLFYQLPNLAKAAFDAGDPVKARSYADQLLAMAPQYPKDWNYGNAIYFGHMVLGRVELVQGNMVLAENHLLQSAQTPGSPQLNSFGPNTSLAKDLLERNDTAVVLQYFALLPKFWKHDYGKVADWTTTVQGGRIPNFGANLVY